MSHHKHSAFHKLKHLIEEVFEETAEFFIELIAFPRDTHHRGSWFWFWGAILLVLGLAWVARATGQSLELSKLYERVADIVYRLYPIWVPLFSFALFAELWLRYIRLDFLSKNQGILLEVRIPKIIEKTPRAMELLMMALYETGSVEYNETYWDGKLRPWWSFEIASFGGDIHFYIWTFPKYRNVLESQIYAQYPTVEVTEADDYAKKKVYNPAHNFMWGTYFKLSKPDVYPIMTYVDYGLDKETEEEYKVDPLSTLLEYIGSMKKGEEVWIQILTQAYKPFTLKEGKLFRDRDWVEEGVREVNKIMKRDPHTKSTRKVTESGFPIIPTLTEWEKKQAEAIERSLDKRAFRVMIRLCYLAEPEAFHLRSPSVSGLLGTFRKPFNSNLLNGFKLGWWTDLRDPTKDFLFLFGLKDWGINKWQAKYSRLMIDAYRRRSFFYAPYRNWKGTPFILTAEELATIYHFPGQIVTTPTFGRIPSKKVEPPPNLPI
ncbi:MAG: hypothetical protein Q7R88_02280 [bacterium]|nr:hypothetical protein [bacterium]